MLPQRMHICFLGCVCNLHVKLANVYVQILFDDLSFSGCVSGRSFMAFMPTEHAWCMSGSSFQISGAVRWARPLSNTPDQRQWTRRRCKDPVCSSTPHLNGHYSDVREFLCYVHRGHTPQNTPLQCIRSFRGFRTQGLLSLIHI